MLTVVLMIVMTGMAGLDMYEVKKDREEKRKQVQETQDGLAL